ncbi:MAG: FG-GAP repeat domain-containing protein, partial [Bacteroidales bacterium]
MGCEQQNVLFEKIPVQRSGIDFVNQITTYDTFSILTFEYIYHGGGVGIADFNQDGLQDIFFSGNQVSSRLYLNQGDFQFEDITENAGVTTNRWATGVSITDINQDGLPDIYVCVSGSPVAAQRANYLFVNQGNNQFEEMAAQYGIADTSYTNHAAFFDYDLDGDLDLYLITTSNDGSARNNIREKYQQGEAENTDILYRNNGNGTFTNVSRQAGILIEGFGLGLSIADINEDG